MWAGIRDRNAPRGAAGVPDEATAIAEVRALLTEVLPAEERQHDPTVIRPIWTPLTRERARVVLTYTLTYDLAYVVPVGDEAGAVALAVEFLDCFAPDARFLTVGHHSEIGRLEAWTPVTVHTFDTGVAAIDAERVGVVWKFGED
ncbi:MAG: hypothetical protein IRY85_06980 [Micromonosporaceae bacterium]|nr:hypothetical protein [Micromonosporaceae bacterium]